MQGDDFSAGASEKSTLPSDGHERKIHCRQKKMLTRIKGRDSTANKSLTANLQTPSAGFCLGKPKVKYYLLISLIELHSLPSGYNTEDRYQ